MPQMAPILWLNLYVIFICIYFIFCSLNFFSEIKISIYKSKTLSKKLINNLNWKW